MEAPRGTIILYSTEPGSVANDGDGHNSPFTHHLMSLMKFPDLDFMDVIRELDARLQNETQGKQAPWMEGIPAKFYFLHGDSKTVQPVIQPSVTTNRTNPPAGMARFGGSFNMGSNEGDSDEKPVHTVSFGEFYISPTEVTVGEFRQFVSAMGYRTDAEKGSGSYVWDGSQWGQKSDANWKNPYFTQTDDHPVTCVNWNDAVAYCNWRSQAEGLTPCYNGIGDNITCNFDANGYRLPTEAEWEYAARGGDNSRRYIYSGSNNVDEVGWYDGNSGMKTHPVGLKKANEMGLYDMTGNVLEWCWDWYDEGYYHSSPSRNPHGPSSGSWRVFRGGSWNIGLGRLRCTDRIGSGPGYSDYSFGFRCVRTR